MLNLEFASLSLFANRHNLTKSTKVSYCLYEPRSACPLPPPPLPQLPDDVDTVTLSALRRDRGRDKRVAVLVGGKDAVQESLESAIPFSAALETSDILIVPLVLDSTGTGADRFKASGVENDLESAVGRPHVGLPVALNRWQEYIDTEVLYSYSVENRGKALCHQPLHKTD